MPLQVLEHHGAANLLLSDFQTPELWKNKLLFWVSLCAVLCYGSLSRLVQQVPTKLNVSNLNMNLYSMWRIYDNIQGALTQIITDINLKCEIIKVIGEYWK